MKGELSEILDEVQKGFSMSPEVGHLGIDSHRYEQVLGQQGYTGADNTAPIQFEIFNTTSDLLDLSESYIVTQLSVQRTIDGGAANVAEDEPITFHNNAAQKLFSRINVYINDVDVSDQCSGGQDYTSHWAGFLDKVTHKQSPYGKSSALRYLTTYTAAVTQTTGPNARPSADIDHTNTYVVDWQHDVTESDLEGFTVSAVPRNAVGSLGENEIQPRLSPAVATRTRSMLGGAVCTLVTKIPMGIFKQLKPLLPGTRLRIVLTKSAADSILMYKKNATAAPNQLIQSVSINWVQSRFMLHRLTLSKAALSTVSAFLSNPATPYRMPFENVRAVYMPFQNGSTVFQRTGILAGTLPESVYIFITKSVQGTAVISPYATATGNTYYTVANDGTLAASADANVEVSEIYVKVAGKRYPENGYRLLGADASDSFEAYEEYLKACGLSISKLSKGSPVLSYAEFRKQYLFFCISLRSDGSYDFTGQLKQAVASEASAGGLELYISTKAALNGDRSVLVIGKNTAFLEMDASGSINRIGM